MYVCQRACACQRVSSFLLLLLQRCFILLGYLCRCHHGSLSLLLLRQSGVRSRVFMCARVRVAVLFLLPATQYGCRCDATYLPLLLVLLLFISVATYYRNLLSAAATITTLLLPLCCALSCVGSPKLAFSPWQWVVVSIRIRTATPAAAVVAAQHHLYKVIINFVFSESSLPPVYTTTTAREP